MFANPVHRLVILLALLGTAWTVASWWAPEPVVRAARSVVADPTATREDRAQKVYWRLRPSEQADVRIEEHLADSEVDLCLQLEWGTAEACWAKRDSDYAMIQKKLIRGHYQRSD
jgi:hypothetical protein